ncbi:MAG: gamma-butyrobetaine hydroxylase-like domain-containing protein [Alphaproteobacteria bacterium]
MSESFVTAHWPKEIRYLAQDKRLEVEFDDGVSFTYPAELLRVESPSAEVKGHGPGDKTLVAGRQHVGIMAIEPVGNYAIRIKFDDLHDTGIFTWPYLYDLGQNQAAIWKAYLAELETNGLSRDPTRR